MATGEHTGVIDCGGRLQIFSHQAFAWALIQIEIGMPIGQDLVRLVTHVTIHTTVLLSFLKKKLDSPPTLLGIGSVHVGRSTRIYTI